MNYSDIFILVLAVAAISYRGWQGWCAGAATEIRHSLMLIFGMLLAIRYWQSVAESLTKAISFDPRWITIGTFILLFSIGAVFLGVLVGLKGQTFQSVERNYLDHVLGLAAGLFTGVLVGASIVWLSTIATPGRFGSEKLAQSFLGIPRDVFCAIETGVGVAPDSAGRTHYPEASLVEVPVDPSSVDVSVPEGSMLMQQRGQISWQ